MDRVLEAVKTRRRAISALLARFAIDATFIGVTVSDVTTGIRWEVAHVIAFAAYVASICVCIRRYGVRVTLSSLLVILSAFCILETLTIIAGDDTSTRVTSLFLEKEVDEVVMKYINRLSDYLFVAARVCSHHENAEETIYK
ncbi:hypothetical protein MTO96_025517 [Rhipicephalus appendiculatus]